MSVTPKMKGKMKLEYNQKSHVGAEARPKYVARSTRLARFQRQLYGTATRLQDRRAKRGLKQRTTTRTNENRNKGRNCYDNTAISGSASAVLGDVHYHYHEIVGADHHQISRAFIPLSPRTLLETSQTFCPQEYTLCNLSSTFHVHSASERAVTDSFRIDEFYVLYSTKSERVQLTVSLTTTSKSGLWNVMHRGSTLGIVLMPPPPEIMRRIEMYIRSTDGVRQFREYKLIAGSTSSKLRRIRRSYEPLNLQSRLEELTRSLPHWGCRHQSERGVDQVIMYRGRVDSLFYAFSDGKWVKGTRFSPKKRWFKCQVQTMKALHQLKGTPGLVPFQGVLRNENGLATSYLCDLPHKGLLFNTLDNTDTDPERRLKWCRQLIEVVQTLHRHDFKVGMFETDIDSLIGLDHNDNAVLCNTFRPYATDPLPPEYRKISCKSRKATHASDIYQLGFVLWRISGDRKGYVRHEFCDTNECTNSRNGGCREPHADPVALPMRDGYYPEYMETIISRCRAENPDERPSASELLERCPFPEQGPVVSSVTTAAKSRDTALEDYQRLYNLDVFCDLCTRTCSHHYFHCNSCHDANFDICAQCYNKGRHCLNTGHILREWGPQDEEGACVKAISASGHREPFSLASLHLSVP